MREIDGRMVLDTLDEIADPKHTALLVIDIQNDNSSPTGILAQNGRDISWVREIIPKVKVVLGEARRLGVRVIFVRKTRSNDGSLEPDNVIRRNARSVHSHDIPVYEVEGTWGNEVLDELEPRANERQIIKYRSSAFIGTPLDLLLRTTGIKAAVVVGIVTRGCVESTVRDLHQYGYYPVVLSDCVANSRKDLHEASLLVMSSAYDVVTSEELLREWRMATPKLNQHGSL
jgi:nicotinamidase-related amidase